MMNTMREEMTSRHIYTHMLSQPAPPVIQTMNPPSATLDPPEPMLHCGFCNTDFSGDVSAHKRLCWPVHARRKLEMFLSKPLNRSAPNCLPGSQICGDCYACYAATRGYMSRIEHKYNH